MKTLKKINSMLYMLCFGAALLATYGCSKDEPEPDNCYDGKWEEQIFDEAQAYSDAISLYSQEPTLANCTAYKSATIAYLDALEEIYDCVPVDSRVPYDESIKRAKDEINNESCD